MNGTRRTRNIAVEGNLKSGSSILHYDGRKSKFTCWMLKKGYSICVSLRVSNVLKFRSVKMSSNVPKFEA